MKYTVVSDTHCQHKNVVFENQEGVLIHCGDTIRNNIPKCHTRKAVFGFLDWFVESEFEHKIIIAGNHDFYIRDNHFDIQKEFEKNGIIYLEDSAIKLNGVNFYGSPWVTTYKGGSRCFAVPEDILSSKFNDIPKETEILITHGAKHGVLDANNNGYNTGSKHLLKKVNELPNLKYHIHGHIHESCGVEKMGNYETINAALDGKSTPITFNF